MYAREEEEAEEVVGKEEEERWERTIGTKSGEHPESGRKEGRKEDGTE